MGKSNFARIYCNIRDELYVPVDESCSIKVSSFSDDYNPYSNFAGFIVYHHDGMCQWTNYSGKAEGYDCQSFYVLISCTDDWEYDDFRRAGQGYVHDKMYRDMFDGDFEDKVTCCGGFAILEGKTRYSSSWLNDQSSRDRYSEWGWNSDGSKLLSRNEKAIVSEAIKTWKRKGSKGPGSVVDVPRAVDQRLRRLGA